jgi:hypothetical protein
VELELALCDDTPVKLSQDTGRALQSSREWNWDTPVKDSHTRINLPFNALLLPAVLCFIFLLVLLMNRKTTSLQTDLPAEVTDCSSYRDRQRHSRNVWTSRFRARNAHEKLLYIDSWRALYCRC